MYSWSQATTVGCHQRPQHLWSHREFILGQKLQQLVVTRGHNIFWSHREFIFGHKLQQLVVTRGHNICEITESVFSATSYNSWLWPEATAFMKSHRVYFRPQATKGGCDHWPEAIIFVKSKRLYSRPQATTVGCDQRPQHLWSNREFILGHKLKQLVVPRGYNI